MTGHRLFSKLLPLFALALLLPFLAFCLRVPPPLKIGGAVWVLAFSVAAFVVYASDKRRAQQGRSRTPENTLHLLGLLGGWPGALLARWLFRHKTAKRSFQIRFWLIVIVYQYFALDWLLHWQISRLFGAGM